MTCATVQPAGRAEGDFQEADGTMPWFRVEDSFDTHPKVIAAGNEAIGVYIRCGTYAARHLTDGFVSRQIALLYGSEALANTLVRVRLWHRTRGGWMIHDYLDYNPSREAVDNDRKQKAARQSRWREAQRRRVTSVSRNASRDAAPSRPERSAVDVINRSNGSRGSPGKPDEIDQIIIKEINQATGRGIDAEWAAKVRRHILDGRTPADPVAYVRSVIRGERNPRVRFLPVY